jgi:hypothetical protein
VVQVILKGKEDWNTIIIQTITRVCYHRAFTQGNPHQLEVTTTLRLLVRNLEEQKIIIIIINNLLYSIRRLEDEDYSTSTQPEPEPEQ